MPPKVGVKTLTGKMINNYQLYLSSHGNQVYNQTWFDATLVYRFNERNRSYNSLTQCFDTPV